MPTMKLCRTTALLGIACGLALPVAASDGGSAESRAVPPPPGPYISSRPLLAPPQHGHHSGTRSAPTDSPGQGQRLIMPGPPQHYGPVGQMPHPMPYGPGAAGVEQSGTYPQGPYYRQPLPQPPQRRGWHW